VLLKGRNMLIIAIPLICILIFLSSFFAAAEMAFVSVDRIRVKEESVKGNKNALILDKLLDNADEVVGAIVICNNIVNITASIVAGALAMYLFGNIGIGIATAVMTLLIVIFGEALPKAYGINNERFAFKVAKPLYWIRVIFYPAVKAFARLSDTILKVLGKERKEGLVITEDRIKKMLEIGVYQGTIKRDEKKLVEEIFEFDETKVRDICVPLEKVVSLKDSDTVQSLIEKAVRTGYSRFPVCGSDGKIVGMVHIKDALTKSKNTPVKEIMRKILVINDSMKVDDVLREMQKNKTHMAIIKTDDGKAVGLVTLEDLIEEVFGEIKDEHDVT